MNTIASKSCMTSGMLEDLRLLIPIATQTLTKAVTFTLGDNSEVTCNEIAYIDRDIQTQMDVINIQGVPVFVLPGPAGGDIMFGVSEQRAIGLATPHELMASRSRVIGSVTARDPLLRNGELVAAAGSEVIKMLKVKMIDTDGEEEMDNDDEDNDIFDATATSSSSNFIDMQNNFRRRGLSGSSKSFEVEEKLKIIMTIFLNRE